MIALRTLALLVVLLASASAADVIYPLGSRVGLAPPPGMSVSRNFGGFEDRDQRAALVVVTLPAAAAADIERSATTEILEKQGMTVEAREAIAHPLGKAFLVLGRQTIEGQPIRKWIFVLATGDLMALVTAQIPDAAQPAYPDAAVRAAIMSVSVRDTIPTDEQLEMVPFRLSELAGFRIGGVIPGQAVMLNEVAPPPGKVDTHIMVALAAGGPNQATDRSRFAHDVFATVPNLKDVRIESSEPLRIGGQQGYQIMARAQDSASGEDINVVQWLRFGPGAYLHVIGVARAPAWIDAYRRFRQVRDGIALR